MDPVIKALIDEAEGLPSKGDNWGEFLKDLKESTFDSEGSYSQGEPSSVTRMGMLEPDDAERIQARIRELEKRV